MTSASQALRRAAEGPAPTVSQGCVRYLRDWIAPALKNDLDNNAWTDNFSQFSRYDEGAQRNYLLLLAEALT